MKNMFDETAFPKVAEILRLKEEAVRARADDEKAAKWLSTALAEDAVRQATDDLLAEYGGARSFVIALGKYLVDRRLITPSAVRPGSIEPDFIDRLQERVV